MSTWALVQNPAYAGKKPTKMVAECHDGTPFLTIGCRCGEQMHVHESQVAAIPLEVEIATSCKSCGELLLFPPGYFVGVFRQLREEGWM